MYIPEAFKETRPDILERFVGDHPLAHLVTNGPDGPDVSVVPMILAADADGRPVLRGHLARANPHWRRLADGVAALALFSGARHYITPSWYPSKRETGKVVPTYNYEVVEVRGQLRAVEDAAWLRDQIRDLTDHNETGRSEPWSVDDMPAAFASAMVRGIVGIELVVEAMTGKMKAGQNRPDADRQGMVDGLRAAGGADALRIAALADEAGGQDRG